MEINQTFNQCNNNNNEESSETAISAAVSSATAVDGNSFGSNTTVIEKRTFTFTRIRQMNLFSSKDKKAGVGDVFNEKHYSGNQARRLAFMLLRFYDYSHN